jgi:hypothetical protein
MKNTLMRDLHQVIATPVQRERPIQPEQRVCTRKPAGGSTNCAWRSARTCDGGITKLRLKTDEMPLFIENARPSEKRDDSTAKEMQSRSCRPFQAAVDPEDRSVSESRLRVSPWLPGYQISRMLRRELKDCCGPATSPWTQGSTGGF